MYVSFRLSFGLFKWSNEHPNHVYFPVKEASREIEVVAGYVRPVLDGAYLGTADELMPKVSCEILTERLANAACRARRKRQPLPNGIS